MSIQHIFDIPIPAKIGVSRAFFCGTEYEIEDVKNHEKVTTLYKENDPSLRNHGVEFKTPPCNLQESFDLFHLLHKNVVLGPNPFTARTSTHVHVNVCNLESHEVKNLILTYALLEPLFFSFVGDDRQNNIFCVPLYFTNMPALYKHSVERMHQGWHKYTAFNILPLGPNSNTAALGTIEFRHLEGTGDFEKYKTWLTILQELYMFIESAPSNYSLIKELLNETSPFEIAKAAVPTLVKNMDAETVNNMCKDTLLDVKLANGGLSK